MVSSIVLAGGKALRLGRNKLLEEVGGKAIILRVLDTLTLISGEIIVVSGAVSSLPAGLNRPGLKQVQDLYPQGGVLGGIFTGLAASGTFHNLAVAGDMPFLNLALLRYMVEQAGDFDVVIPRVGDFIEPLHALYSKRCLPYVNSEIDRGSRNIRSFFPRVKVKYIETPEIDRFDPDHISFFNINTEEDLVKARKLAAPVE